MRTALIILDDAPNAVLNHMPLSLSFLRREGVAIDMRVMRRCEPSRHAMLTGMYPWRSDQHGVDQRHEDDGAPTDVLMISEVIGAIPKGYFGKWHRGERAGHRPQERGFTEGVWSTGGWVYKHPPISIGERYDDGTTGHSQGEPLDAVGRTDPEQAGHDLHILEEGGSVRPYVVPAHITDVTFRHAVEFAAREDLDWHMTVAANSLHEPWACPVADLPVLTAAEREVVSINGDVATFIVREGRAALSRAEAGSSQFTPAEIEAAIETAQQKILLGEIKDLDRNLFALLTACHEAGAKVVLTNDNGAAADNSIGNSPYVGGKGQTASGARRVFGFGLGFVQTSLTMSALDIAPTFAALHGGSISVDGRDVSGVLLGTSAPPPYPSGHRCIEIDAARDSRGGKIVSASVILVHDRYALVRELDEESTVVNRWLFDTLHDPKEEHNLISDPSMVEVIDAADAYFGSLDGWDRFAGLKVFGESGPKTTLTPKYWGYEGEAVPSPREGWAI